MGFNDMHVHTSSSPDAEMPAARICSFAEDAGVERIGFVAHLDLHPEDYCYMGFSEKDFLSELDEAETAYSGRVRVLRGIEIGEPHEFMDRARALTLFKQEEYDFLTGALHWTGNDLILDEKPFLEQNPFALVEEYYRQTLAIVEKGGINILAHMGIFRRGMARAGLSTCFDEAAMFPGLISKILNAMIEKGIALELNTSGLRREEKVTYPTPRIVEMFYRLGGERITVGSDSHMERSLFFGLRQGAELLREYGFSHGGYFLKGRYMQSPLQR